MLRKRTIMETIFDQLKNISQIEHSRDRNINHFLTKLLPGMTAYQLKDKKTDISPIKPFKAILILN